VSGPAAFGWSGGVNSNTATCTYTWMGGAPNPCELPASDGQGPFTWLHPVCDAGCP
jgi:hypothetical protein